MNQIPSCPRCKSVDFRHFHETAHGIQATHLAGSERFQCQHCNYSLFKVEGEKLGLVFSLD